MSNSLEVIKTVLPWVGTALGGPLAPIISGLAAKLLDIPAERTEEALSALVSTPEGRLKAMELESAAQIKLVELGYKSLDDLNQLIFKGAAEVNATMRAETTAEHWPQYSWRPFNGFLFGITIFSTYFLLPLLGKSAPTIPPEIWLTWGGILGVASFFRGKMQADPNIPTSTKLTNSTK